jgi:hypothetical protein
MQPQGRLHERGRMAQAFTSMRRDRGIIRILYGCGHQVIREGRKAAQRLWTCRKDLEGVENKPELVIHSLDMSLARGHPENAELPAATRSCERHNTDTGNILSCGQLYSPRNGTQERPDDRRTIYGGVGLCGKVTSRVQCFGWWRQEWGKNRMNAGRA